MWQSALRQIATPARRPDRKNANQHTGYRYREQHHQRTGPGCARREPRYRNRRYRYRYRE